MKQLTFMVVQADGQRQITQLSALHTLSVQDGAVYSLFDTQSEALPETLLLKRKGDDLEVEVEEETVVYIDDFYSSGTVASFSALSAQEGAEILVSSGDVLDSALVSDTGEATIVWSAHEESAFLGGSSAIWAGGLLAAGGLGVIAAHNNNDSDDTTVSEEGYVVNVSAYAGAFVSVATVELYDNEGNLLASQSHDFSEGSAAFTLSDSYVGALLVKIIDSNGDAGDYIDETTGELVSIGDNALRAILIADGSELSVSVTPLTELVACKAGIGDDNSVTEENVALNDLVATLFGIEDLLGSVTTILDSDFSAADGIDGAELYGKFLALFSGTDSAVAASNGLSTVSISATINALCDEIVLQDGVFSLTAAGVTLLEAGLAAFTSGDNGDIADLTDLIPSSADDSSDTVAPTLTISDDTAGVAIGDVTYTFTFSEDVSGFTVDDITVSGGDKGTFSAVSDSEYTLVVTPTSDSTTDISVDVAAGVATDSAGNSNTAATQSTQAVDTVIPTVVISDDTAGVATGDVTYTFTFSEDVSGFTVDDITLTGGSKGTFTTVSTTEYTLVVTPEEASSTAMTVNVAADVASDAAGNGNTVAAESTQAIADTSVVIFDLVGGNSSEHSDRTFDDTTAYTIYIKVDSDSEALNTGTGDFAWTGGDNLGADDLIILVGSGSGVRFAPNTTQNVSNVVAPNNNLIFWRIPSTTTTTAVVANVTLGGTISRTYNSTTGTASLWSGSWAVNPNMNPTTLTLSQQYLATLPAGILTSQGLV